MLVYRYQVVLQQLPLPIVNSWIKVALNARIQAELTQLNVDDVFALAETGAKSVNGLLITH